MRLRFWTRGAAPEPGGPPALPAALSAPVTHRQFLKIVLGTVGGASLALAGARSAQATYTGGDPTDTVDRNLTVNGNLTVSSSTYGPGNVGIGTTSPAGKLDVAGNICVNGTQAVDSGGVVIKSYYAP